MNMLVYEEGVVNKINDILENATSFDIPLNLIFLKFCMSVVLVFSRMFLVCIFNVLLYFCNMHFHFTAYCIFDFHCSTVFPPSCILLY